MFGRDAKGDCEMGVCEVKKLSEVDDTYVPPDLSSLNSRFVLLYLLAHIRGKQVSYRDFPGI